MNKFIASAVALLTVASTSSAFVPMPLTRRPRITSIAVSGQYFDTPEAAGSEPSGEPKVPKRKVEVEGHKEGLFTPLVLSAKKLLGEERLNKVRAKAISLHSNTIASFVATAETPFGEAALNKLFLLADWDKSGTIEEEELKAAFKTLGFTWLQEKQVRGILERADINHDGKLDFEEWKREAPKTLKTNLIKLAKKNGNDLGFLA
jgi:hypothetical protein